MLTATTNQFNNITDYTTPLIIRIKITTTQAIITITHNAKA
jgi:hypothetical protein